MTKAQLNLFEKNNPNLLINLLEWQGEKDQKNPVHVIRPAPRPKKFDDAQDIKVVTIMAVELNDGSWHYVGVPNLDRLLNKSGQRRTYCVRCLQPLFTGSKNIATKREDLMKEHLKTCMMLNPDSVKMTEKSVLEFEGHAKTQRLPYVAYADTECYLEKDPEDANVIHHIPCSIGILLVPHPEMKAKPFDVPYKVFTGPKCMEEACVFLDATARKVYNWNKVNANQQPCMSFAEKKQFTDATGCYICKKPFSNELPKVLEHDHLTAKYRGAACQPCNTKMRQKKNVLPVFFHNLRGYDGHLLCESGLNKLKKWELSVIPLTKEKYLSITAAFIVDSFKNKKTGEDVAIKMKIHFKDTAQFLQASLDHLVKNLVEGDENLVRQNMVHSLKCLPNDAPLSLITSKGIFPYEWFDSVTKLESRSLPTIDCFYDK